MGGFRTAMASRTRQGTGVLVQTEERAKLRTPPSSTLNIRGAASIWQRELIRFFRERSRAVTSLVQPLLYLLVFGTGLGASASAIEGVEGSDYRIFLLPG